MNPDEKIMSTEQLHWLSNNKNPNEYIMVTEELH